MNRELRRLQEREEKRQQKQRAKGVPQRRPKRERASFMQFLRAFVQHRRKHTPAGLIVGGRYKTADNVF